MGYLVAFIFGLILGAKYQELRDLMLARRIAKMVSQSEQIARERAQFDRAVALDKKFHDKMYAEAEREEEVL